MDAVYSGIAVLALLLLYLGLGVWVFAAILLVATTSLLLLLGFSLERIGLVASGILMRSATKWELSAVPLFIWMGEIIHRTDLSERLFRGLAPFVDRLPGRLLHTNVAGCTLFAAVCGSSAATTATVGKITTTALSARGYDTKLAIGSLAGAGSLGLLIPPSIVMIVYGVLAEVSITKLFIAGFLPGLFVAGTFSLYIVARCMLDPGLAPRDATRFTGADMLRGLLDLAPLLVLIVVVLGSIYTGLATPSEAAAVGVLATLVISALRRQLSWRMLGSSLKGTVGLSCMILLLTVSASLLATAMAYLRLPAQLAATVAPLMLSKYELIFAIGVLYLILGCFLDGVSITVMTLPVVLPLIKLAGFDPLWFGIFLVVMVELAQVTPPVGFNLFVIQGLTGRTIGYVAMAAAPFAILMLGCLSVMTIFPEAVLWLPNMVAGR